MLFGAGGAHAIAVDALVSERNSIESSHRMMNEIGSAAESIMTSLRSQRGMLKSAHKKVLDVSSLLGVSSTLLRVIERRTLGDRVLVYGGMVLIVLLICLIYWFTS